eukprot:CAMPEP_0114272436 /NCGR_PEP_ID=MMETSP0058-20121206/28480_1 /TAXON_ID=36894 /ORGANISM="Pyramimonas parkeae, CCMP726" /LENGTH=70 /DNA_ID=CAMNT_0001391659 /DNA_START=190 /DNA_END=399 /DNA_ORIENTATION=-
MTSHLIVRGSTPLPCPSDQMHGTKWLSRADSQVIPDSHGAHLAHVQRLDSAPKYWPHRQYVHWKATEISW